MTDKELAKEYVDKLYEEKVNNKDFDKDGWILYRCEDINDAFLAGLKAGRPKWHDVAGGDLPKEQKEYWCKVFFYESEETFNAFLWFDLGTKEFKFLEEIKEDVESSFKVKEWCEIPRYTED